MARKSKKSGAPPNPNNVVRVPKKFVYTTAEHMRRHPKLTLADTILGAFRSREGLAVREKAHEGQLSRPPSQHKASLYDVLQSSYGSEKGRKRMAENGYVYDAQLSNHNESVFYNSEKGKLVYAIAGSHDKRDFLVSDVKLGLGKLLPKSLSFTQDARFLEAKNKLAAAKSKYRPTSTVVAGHSLGGTIASKIGDPSQGDRVFAFNQGATLGQSSRPGVTAIRTRGDLISALSSGNRDTHNVTNTALKVLEVNPRAPEVLKLAATGYNAFVAHGLEPNRNVLERYSID